MLGSAAEQENNLSSTIVAKVYGQLLTSMMMHIVIMPFVIANNTFSACISVVLRVTIIVWYITMGTSITNKMEIVSSTNESEFESECDKQRTMKDEQFTTITITTVTAYMFFVCLS